MFSLKNKYLFIILFFNLSNIISSDDTQKQNIEEDLIILKEETLDFALAQKNTIEYALEHLLQLINKETLKVKNKKEVINWANDIKLKLFSIKKTLFSHASKKKVYVLLSVNNEAIKIISKAIDSKFKKLNTLDLKDIELRPTPKQLTLETLQIFTLHNQKKLENLLKKVENSGINIINKTYRTLENINKKYGIIPITAKGSILCLMAATCIYFMPNELIKEVNIPILTKLKNKIGSKIEVNQLTREIQGQNNGLGEIEEALFKTVGIHFAPAIIFPWFLNQFKKDLQDLTKLLLKSSKVIHHKLRGATASPSGWHSIDEQKITFEDVIGCENAKNTMKDIIKYMKYPERFDRAGTPIEKGILLYGPPGTGKTLCVRALAGELKKEIGSCAFKEVTWWDLIKKSVKGLLEDAKKNAPCVLFIDEIDSLQLQRDNREQWSNFLTEFLTGMSGLNSNTPGNNRVILIAATNKVEHLDEALRRYGRFGTHIIFEKPKASERRKYFQKALEKFAINLEEINIEQLIKETAKCSYSDLEEVVRYAQFLAKTKEERLEFKHFKTSLDKKIRKIVFNNNFSQQELALLAAHYAGHIMANLILQPNNKFSMATILPINKQINEHLMFGDNGSNNRNKNSAKYGQIFTYKENEAIKIDTNEEKIKKVKILLAGHISEKILLGSSGYSFHKKDKKKALKKIKNILLAGLEEEDLPKNIRKKYIDESFMLLEKYENEITKLLELNKEKLYKIKKLLEEKYTVTIQDIENIF